MTPSRAKYDMKNERMPMRVQGMYVHGLLFMDNEVVPYMVSIV